MIAYDNPLRSRLQDYLSFGLGHLDQKDHRGGRLCNLLSLVAAIASVAFGCFYLVQDAGGLLAPALVCFFFVPVFFATPLMMRLGIVAATALIILNLTLLTVINTYLMSRDAGLHTGLLIIAPAIGVLLLGVNRRCCRDSAWQLRMRSTSKRNCTDAA